MRTVDQKPSRAPHPVRPALFAVALCLAGCGGPGHIDYDGGRCLTDGRPMTADQVEAEQAEVAQRIASRQPWFAFITIGVVLVAAASNAERALLLVRSHHADGHRSLTERLRDVLARQRDNPVLFAAIVGGSLTLAATGGAFYIYLDIDKRANERALGMLQFCHIALRAEKEQTALDEERKNLQAIQSTAGDIRTLVGKLPPDEQQKAHLIVSQMNEALAQQDRIVGDFAARTDEAQKDLSTHAATMEKGLASVEGDLAALRSLPTNLRDLATATLRVDQATTSMGARFDDLHRQVGAVDEKLDALLARPACTASAPPVTPKIAGSRAQDAGVRPAALPATDGGVSRAHS
jgi:hypothetical protein